MDSVYREIHRVVGCEQEIISDFLSLLLRQMRFRNLLWWFQLQIRLFVDAAQGENTIRKGKWCNRQVHRAIYVWKREILCSRDNLQLQTVKIPLQLEITWRPRSTGTKSGVARSENDGESRISCWRGYGNGCRISISLRTGVEITVANTSRSPVNRKETENHLKLR